MKKRILSFLSALLAPACLFSACSSAPADNETTAVNSNALFAEDPADDGVLRILMIGNSGCYYFNDELYEMLALDGIKVEVSNVYYSGCSVERHWQWLNDKSANYDFITYSSAGKKKLESYTLDACLEAQNWDIITLQQAFWPDITVDFDTVEESTCTNAKNLLDYIKEKFPQSEILWHHTWAYQVGFPGSLTKDPATVSDDRKIFTTEKQTAFYECIRKVCNAVCEENEIGIIPVGDAWQIARSNPAVGDTLCNKNGTNQGDNLHDGDTGGGQYLNACVWYEIISGKSCIGNTFRPDYQLSEEKIAALQEAAHQAVIDIKGL